MIRGKILNTYNYLCRLPWGNNNTKPSGGLRSLGMVAAPNQVSSVQIKRYIIGEREREREREEEVDGEAYFVIPHTVLVFF